MNVTAHDADRLGCITVTYFPDSATLKTQLESLPADAVKVVVDNGTAAEQFDEARMLVECIPGVLITRLPQNEGLAKATNVGARVLEAHEGVKFVLLLDQDSIPHAGAIESLQSAYLSISGSGARVGAVGPLLVDPDSRASHGFHQARGVMWVRHPGTGSEPVECAGLNGSGTFMRLDDFIGLGGLREGFFIDHVDTEWSFRMTASGYRLFGVPGAVFSHRMGEASRRVWLGQWRAWPVRSPIRHRYLFRNAVALLRSRHAPLAWKAWAVPKLILTAFAFAVSGPKRLSQLRNMCLGLVDGLMGREGPLK